MEIESFDIVPGQATRIPSWNDLTSNSIDRHVVVAPASARSNGETTPKIDDAKYLEQPFAPLPYLPSTENARITLPGMKPSEP
jgi:hypothetical protein